MLAALRQLPALDRATRQGRGWPTDPALGETVRDLGSCTVGLIGYGNIAKRVHDIVAAMGADVLRTWGTSRGAVVDEGALVDALRDGLLARRAGRFEPSRSRRIIHCSPWTTWC